MAFFYINFFELNNAVLRKKFNIDALLDHIIIMGKTYIS